MIKKQDILDSIQTLKDVEKDVEEIKQQFITPMTVSKKKPSKTEGENGDRKVIKEGNDNYLYIKVDGRWMKTQLEEI